MKKLHGKIALVTGGGSGIGQAIARCFLDEGARVAIVGRTLAKLQQAAHALGGPVTPFAADVANYEQVVDTVEKVQKTLGPIDILVNNAGTNIKDRTFRELSIHDWQKLVGTNLNGAFYCMKAVCPGMIERKSGLVININSVSGKRAGPLSGIAYVASKFGMAGLGLGLGTELKDSGIRVTNIYPGEVDTPILEHRPQPVSDEARSKILKPEDVAAAVMFVASLPPHVSVPELIIKPAGAGILLKVLEKPLINLAWNRYTQGGSPGSRHLRHHSPKKRRSETMPPSKPALESVPAKEAKTSPLHGGIGVLVVAAFIGFVSIFSFAAFVYQGTYRLPSGESFLSIDPGWVLGHLIRGVTLGLVTWRLWNYRQSLDCFASPSTADKFSAAHAALWNTTAIAFAVLVAYNVLYVMASRTAQ